MNSESSFEQAFADGINHLAVTLRPGTVENYHSTVSNFLHYLHAAYPEVLRPSQLCRDPHILGWLRSMHERRFKSGTRAGNIFRLRRLLDNLALPRLILQDDLPPLDKYLPKPLSPEDDRLLDLQLRQKADLLSYGLLLLRATGMRVGECVDLSVHCLRPLGQEQWVLMVPLGKLHTERWIPVDDNTRKIIDQILSLRGPANSEFLFPRRDRGQRAAIQAMRHRVKRTARKAGCSVPVTPHMLRHSFATEMLRGGVSLPALKELLGHKDIQMTLRYVQVTQNDLQQQYRKARQSVAHRYTVPGLSCTMTKYPTVMGLHTFCSSLDGLIQSVDIYTRHLGNNAAMHSLQRLIRRLKKISTKMATLEE